MTEDRHQTEVPARLDQLLWSRFHWRVVIALGIIWILNGLEVTPAGSLAAAIHQSPSLALTETEIGLTASAYLVGAVGGALYFGWFFAFAAVSAAYLTVGESFSLEMRAMAIRLFYVIGAAVGGVIGPTLFGVLIEGGERGNIMWGYLVAAALMLVVVATERRLGFAAECMPLENASKLLAAVARASEGTPPDEALAAFAVQRKERAP